MIPESIKNLPTMLQSGDWPTPHVQGIAIDTRREHIYYAFTTTLVKFDMKGNLIGTVTGLTGHLGCLDFCDADGRVYGSLEYKAQEAFYIAIFDVDKIDRVGMDAEKDGIMTTVYLREVVDDFTADMDHNGVFDGDIAETEDHRYGCSGIDGVAFGPAFGEAKESKQFLHVAYGIYGNNARKDNDYQVILAFDTADWRKYERPLNQQAPHTCGPEKNDGKYFVFTGNTTYGVQNLEYDAVTGNWLMAVYNGRKPEYPNWPLYIIDGSKKPVEQELKGIGERGMTLSLLEDGVYDEKTGLYGWTFPYGQTGLFSLDNGYFYISHNGHTEDGKQNSTVYLYRWTGKAPEGFERV